MTRFAKLAVIAVLVTYALSVLGGIVRLTGSGMGCPDWPLCSGQILPPPEIDAILAFSHRIVTLLAGLTIVATAIYAWRRFRNRPSVVRPAILAVVLFAVQVLLGAVTVWSQLSSTVVTLHLILATLIIANMVVVALAMLREETPSTTLPALAGAAGIVADPLAAPSVKMPSLADLRAAIAPWIALTKPRVISLLLVTTWAAMWIASSTPPSLGLVFWTLVGGYLAAGGANAINMYMDRDIDVLMGRTARRPLPSHKLEPRHALVFGIALGVLSFVLMTVFVNLLSAVLAQVGLLFYIFVYTGWLKRTTTQNIVIGGAAGAVPPLVGWAAVTGEITWAAIWLFLIVFMWTPPHFWALALVRQGDYARARVPMLPVVVGAQETYRQIVIYSFVMVAVTLAFVPIAGAGLIYLVSALALGALFIYMALRLQRVGTAAPSWKLYKYSLLYLALLFVAMMVDHSFPLAFLF